MSQEAGKVEPSKPGEPTPSLDALNPAQAAALAALPAAPAAALHYVWEQNEDRADLLRKTLKLLEKGTLANAHDGKSTIERIKELGDTPRLGGLSTQYVTERAVSILAEPENNISQGTNATCGAAALEYHLTSSPSRFVQVVDRLTNNEGRIVAFSNGLKRVSDVTYDPRGREPVNKILQDALMQAAGGPKHGEYDPNSDRFADGSKGLQALEVAKQAANIEGEEQAVVLHDSGTSAVFKELFHALPSDRPTHIGSYWNKQDHIVVYRGEKDGVASFFNPQTKGMEMIDVDTFLFKTQFAIFPAEMVKPRVDELPKDAVYFVQPDQPQETQS